MYRVEIDWAPAYELVASLKAFVNRSDHRTLELGSDWLKDVRHRIQPELARTLSTPVTLTHVAAIDVLIRECPGERDATGFLDWLEALSLGELYERLEPHILKGRAELLADLAATRDRYLTLLTAWNDQYFRHVDRKILAGLAADAGAKRELARSTTPEQLLEVATSGVLFGGDESEASILLVPQYYYRPWNLFSSYRDYTLVQYPADAVPPAPGEPPSTLVRAARALSDPSRLRILRYLAQEPRSFAELVQLTGLSKSTVHHHMVILRAARLVRVREAGAKPKPGSLSVSYSLRPGASGEVSRDLSAYLCEENGP